MATLSKQQIVEYTLQYGEPKYLFRPWKHLLSYSWLALLSSALMLGPNGAIIMVALGAPIFIASLMRDRKSQLLAYLAEKIDSDAAVKVSQHRETGYTDQTINYKSNSNDAIKDSPNTSIIDGIAFPLFSNLSPEEIKKYAKDKCLWLNENPHREKEWLNLCAHNKLLENGEINGTYLSGSWLYEVNSDHIRADSRPESVIDNAENNESGELAQSGLRKMSEMLLENAQKIIESDLLGQENYKMGSEQVSWSSEELFDMCLFSFKLSDMDEDICELYETYRPLFVQALADFIRSIDKISESQLKQEVSSDVIVDSSEVHRAMPVKELIQQSPEFRAGIEGSSTIPDNSDYLLRDKAIIIRLSKTYSPNMSEQELYKASRGNWALNLERARKARFAYITYKGKIVGVFAIKGWQETNELSGNGSFRIRFYGQPDEERKVLVGKDISYFFKKGETSPAKYLNC